MPKQEQSTGDDGSTLALKPRGRVNQNLTQRVPVTPQNRNLSPQKKNFKTKKNQTLSYMATDFYNEKWPSMRDGR